MSRSTRIVDLPGTQRAEQPTRELSARPGSITKTLSPSHGHRSSSLVWALLGVMKAGAAFVIGSAYRRRGSLSISNSQSLPAGFRLEAAGPLDDSLARIRIDVVVSCEAIAIAAYNDPEPFVDYPATSPGTIVGADDLAYLSFASALPANRKPSGRAWTTDPLSPVVSTHVEFNETIVTACSPDCRTIRCTATFYNAHDRWMRLHSRTGVDRNPGQVGRNG